MWSVILPSGFGGYSSCRLCDLPIGWPARTNLPFTIPSIGGSSHERADGRGDIDTAVRLMFFVMKPARTEIAAALSVVPNNAVIDDRMQIPIREQRIVERSPTMKIIARRPRIVSGLLGTALRFRQRTGVRLEEEIARAGFEPALLPLTDGWRRRQRLGVCGGWKHAHGHPSE